MTDISFSRENLDNTMLEYEPLLCAVCKVKLRAAAEPIKDRLNDGKPPKLRHMKRLLGVLCSRCTVAIGNKKRK